jgi:hypothetical protein
MKTSSSTAQLPPPPPPPQAEKAMQTQQLRFRRTSSLSFPSRAPQTPYSNPGLPERVRLADDLDGGMRTQKPTVQRAIEEGKKTR